MECEVCRKEARKNEIVCSEQCQAVRLKFMELDDKYFPTSGCENCRGDLHQGCSEKCKQESRDSYGFNQDLWSLIRIIYPK